MNRIKELRNSRDIKQNDLASQLDISQGTLSGWENGKYEPDLKSINKLCNIFNVSMDYLMGAVDSIYCPDCGQFYNPLETTESSEHKKYHQKWQDAVCKYGFCWSYIKSDELELMAKRVLEDENSSYDLQLLSAEDILRAHFSNELRKCDFVCPDDFNTFAPKELQRIRNILPEKVYDALKDKYGAAPEKKIIALNARDERDIKKDLYSLMEKLSNREYGPAAFDGDDIPEDDQELFAGQLELMLRRLKTINKEKYNPHKNKK